MTIVSFETDLSEEWKRVSRDKTIPTLIVMLEPNKKNPDDANRLLAEANAIVNEMNALKETGNESSLKFIFEGAYHLARSGMKWPHICYSFNHDSDMEVMWEAVMSYFNRNEHQDVGYGMTYRRSISPG